MKILLFAVLISISYLCHSQIFVNGKNINDDPDINFIIVKHMNNKLVSVDAGDREFSQYKDVIEDDDGDQKKFETVGGMINYLNKNGWDYVESFNSIPREYLFKKKTDS